MNRDADFSTLLRNYHLKATPKRLAILDVLAHDPTYLSPEDVWKRLKGLFKNIGLPTVYRNLEYLSNAGIIIKVVHPDRKLYYYYCHNADHHHHFVCTACKKVEDLTFCGMEDIEQEVTQRLKGRVVSHFLQVFGYCRECCSGSALQRRSGS
ncbi:MAG TPA: transcriptional repressor [Syntrophorhabdaceae bacterium]|nr:transcriptional repressor [Syntrophorhabdaceae bacterium]